MNSEEITRRLEEVYGTDYLNLDKEHNEQIKSVVDGWVKKNGIKPKNNNIDEIEEV